MKIILNEADFRDLVAGKLVSQEHGFVQIVLSDIGWDRMLDALADAMVERGLDVNTLRRILHPKYPPARPDDSDDD